MNRLYQKIPFLLELFFNGLFLFLYSFAHTESLNFPFVNPEFLNKVMGFLMYLAPIVVFLSVVSNFIESKSFDVFFRRHAFSIIIFIAMAISFRDIDFIFWLSAVHLLSSVISLYEFSKEKSQEVRIKKRFYTLGLIEKIKLKPAQIVLLSFGGIIIFGTFILYLPFLTNDGKNLSFLDAFFVATSATCVTGLTPVSVGDTFNVFGQIAILFLVQIGGLGYMTLYSLMTILLGKSLAVKDQVMMQDILDVGSFEGLKNLIVDIVKITFTIEFWGAVLLSLGFFVEGFELGESMYLGIFHSITAFCNAGFSVFNTSMETYSDSPLLMNTISLLTVFGGLGFIVIREIVRRKSIRNLSFHSKVVTLTTFLLLFIPTFYIFFVEFNHAFETHSLFHKLQIAFFEVVTHRTAGFSSIPYSEFYLGTVYIMTLLMFIGGSPGSMAGGLKTTTFAILFQTVKSTIKGKKDVTFFERKIPPELIIRSVAIMIISMITVSFSLLLLIQAEPDISFFSLFFEAISAFSTTGATSGVTSIVGSFGKIILIFLMYVGRVGPVTMVLAIGQKRENSGQLEYPYGRIMIG